MTPTVPLCEGRDGCSLDSPSRAGHSTCPVSPPRPDLVTSSLITHRSARDKAFRHALDAPVLKSLSPDFAVDCQTLKDRQGVHAEDSFLRVPGPEARARNGLGTTRWWDLCTIPQRHRENPSAHISFRADSGEAQACLQGPWGRVIDFIVST